MKIIILKRTEPNKRLQKGGGWHAYVHDPSKTVPTQTFAASQSDALRFLADKLDDKLQAPPKN